ncbi:hypothetical protein ACRAWF_02100 [Streptomyces sp. L7]
MPAGAADQEPAVPLLMLSRGVPMLLAGDEFRNSQGGNNNGYCQGQPDLLARLEPGQEGEGDDRLHPARRPAPQALPHPARTAVLLRTPRLPLPARHHLARHPAPPTRLGRPQRPGAGLHVRRFRR